MSEVNITIPVYNEEKAIVNCVEVLRDFLQKNVIFNWTIVIADNASTDSTLAIAKDLSIKYPDVTYYHIDIKGRGRALRKVWLDSKADIVSYMDVDLSTGLEAFLPLIESISDGKYDIATGSRLIRESCVKRSPKREFTSRCYNILIKSMFFTKFHDAQCGFKAVSRKAVQEIVPLIVNQKWFFDTELLIIGEKKGYRIKEIPVKWDEDPGTTVNIKNTVVEDIKGLMRLRFHFPK
jgi:glycosyltransferase involved in cell wall biosynthesis